MGRPHLPQPAPRLHPRPPLSIQLTFPRLPSHLSPRPPPLSHSPSTPPRRALAGHATRRLAVDPTAPFFGSIFGGAGGGGIPGARPPVAAASSCIPFAPLCPPLYRSPACCVRGGDGATECGPYAGSCPAGKSAFCCG